MTKLIKLHPTDNVQIVVEEMLAGERLWIGSSVVPIVNNVSIGHKIADRAIKSGEKIIKYGVPIGSATINIEIGEHIHLHNMKSDYIPTYTIEKEFKEKDT